MEFGFDPYDGDFGLEIHASENTHDFLFGLDGMDRTGRRAEASVLATLNMRYIVAYRADNYPVLSIAVDAINNDDVAKLDALNYSVALYDRERKEWMLSEKLTIDIAKFFRGGPGRSSDVSTRELQGILNHTAANQIVELIESRTKGRIELHADAFRADGTQYYPEPIGY